MAGESRSQMIDRVRPSVVLIRRSSGAHGTGVIFNTDSQYGYVVTNRHVVMDEREVVVTVNDSTPRKGLVLGLDDIFDLAFVKIAGEGLRAIPLGDSSRVEAGDDVVAIGYPLQYQNVATVTTGIVSARQYDRRHRSEVIMSQVTMNPGNSGGPMLSVEGEILGINTFISSNTPGNAYGFAIPESAIRTFASRLSIPVPARRARPSGPLASAPARQPQTASPQAGAKSRGLGDYAKVFGLGFAGGAVLGVAAANLVLGIKGDLSITLIISGLIGGGLAVFARMKIR